jgi:hypothetical protein
MKLRWLVVLCWIQVGLGLLSVLLATYTGFARPTLQFEYAKRSGRIIDIIPGGTADRSGLRPTDRVVAIAGRKTMPGANALYLSRAGEVVPVTVLRDRQELTLQIPAVPMEAAREQAVRSGGRRAVSAISSYLAFPLNFWMLALGITLLVLRPDNNDARLSALSFIYWASGNFLADIAGMGALLAPLNPTLRSAFFIADSFFVAAFFAVALHFAIVFPSERGKRVPLLYQLLPYLAAVPIFVEIAAQSLAKAGGHPVTSSTDIYGRLGPLLLVVALVVLAVRFTRTSDRNARRRLQLIFIALLPGVAGFVISSIIDRSGAGYMAQELGRCFNQLCTIASSAIYAYAVVRNRMYDVRVLVRRSIQYAFARGTLLFVMSLPVVGLALFLWTRRNDSLASLLTGTPAIYLLLILPLVAVIRYRKRVLDALDRQFFREQYDARRLLLQVVSMIRDGSDTSGVARAATGEIDRALHPKHVSLWRLDSDGREFVRELAHGHSPSDLAPLPNSGALPTLLATDAEPLDINSRQTRGLLRRLPEDERQWLSDADAHLLVPLLFEQRLGGLLLLGERMSEEPYSREDRELLRTIAAQLALTFDYSRLKKTPPLVWTPAVRTPAPVEDELWSCTLCGRCYDVSHEFCEVDRQRLVREHGVPRTIEDKYVITRMLGRGGMGSVYMATQTRLNRPVAIKVLLGHLVASTSMRNRFEREARIVARLRHPAIVTIHDFGVLPSSHAYLVMEYLDGPTLRKTLQGGPVALQAMLRLMRPVCDAVDSAHRAGVVHRDLKPENIVVITEHDGEPGPRVLDFGLAKMSGPLGEEEVTIPQSDQTVGIVGTLMYLAPEVLSGKEADARSDQYSLGLIIYELLAGRHPFGSLTDLASIVKAQTGEIPRPLHPAVAGVPPHVSDAIDRALSKEAHERFPSVAELMAAMG